MNAQQFTTIHEALSAGRGVEVQIGNNTLTVKAWSGGMTRRIYVNKGGQQVGYFDADGDLIGGRQLMSYASSIEAQLSAALVEMFIPAPAVEAPAEEATPARLGVNAPLYGYKAFRLAQRRYRQLEVEAQNATLIAFEWSHRSPEIDAMHDKARLEIDAEMAALKPLIDAAQARIDAKIDAMEGGYERYFALWKKWRSL